MDSWRWTEEKETKSRTTPYPKGASVSAPQVGRNGRGQHPATRDAGGSTRADRERLTSPEVNTQEPDVAKLQREFEWRFPRSEALPCDPVAAYPMETYSDEAAWVFKDESVFGLTEDFDSRFGHFSIVLSVCAPRVSPLQGHIRCSATKKAKAISLCC
jgi:hypothetical protein